MRLSIKNDHKLRTKNEISHFTDLPLQPKMHKSCSMSPRKSTGKSLLAAKVHKKILEEQNTKLGLPKMVLVHLKKQDELNEEKSLLKFMEMMKSVEEIKELQMKLQVAEQYMKKNQFLFSEVYTHLVEEFIKKNLPVSLEDDKKKQKKLEQAKLKE